MVLLNNKIHHDQQSNHNNNWGPVHMQTRLAVSVKISCKNVVSYWRFVQIDPAFWETETTIFF